MAEEKLFAQLKALFQETGQAHHEAFLETDGADPDWPIWYADYLHEKLSALLQADFTRSELVYLLVRVDKERSLQAPGSDWGHYYARFFLDRYGT